MSKLTAENLKELVQYSYEVYQPSIKEAREVVELFHNRQYTEAELQILRQRGQPPETFNIIKMFARYIIGYYSTIINAVSITPRQISDTDLAIILNDFVAYTFQDNQFESEGDKIKADGILTGLMCSYIDVERTGKTDDFGRPLYRIQLNHVPSTEVLLDPESTLEDYSDGRYIHRYKWFSKARLKQMFDISDQIIAKFQPSFNWTEITEADILDSAYFTQQIVNDTFDQYLIMHTVILEDEDVWSIFWHNDTIFLKEKVSYKEVQFPYRVQKIHTSYTPEFYGLFREVINPQKAINQAIVKLQLLISTQKAFVQKNAVDDLAEFTTNFNRVNAVIQVNNLEGIKIENLSKDVIDLYGIIDKNLTRVQMVLGITDAFLGMAFASDSGRKVKLQQNSTAMALRYVSIRMEQYYRLLCWDIVHLIKQYYLATQVIHIADETSGTRWVQANAPVIEWTGEIDPTTGQPIFDYVYVPVLDPASGEVMEDTEGNMLMAPLSTAGTDIPFADVDISIDSTAYNDQDEKAQLFIETFLSGPIGQTIAKVNLTGYMNIAALAIKGFKSKYSFEIAKLIEQTAAMVSPEAQQAVQGNSMVNPAQSQQLKLPQNTNEGI